MTHKDLDVWKRSVIFVTSIYEITKSFPKEDIYGLTSQIRKCAVSIPSNIAEGGARKSKVEFRQFLYISLGSAAELETQLLIATNLNILEVNDSKLLMEELNAVSRMLQGLIKSLNIS
ncbi:MAG: four helix bundle protein [Flavobacteriia bacterium]|nr:four helix bundle protein [Flavobacteriia bacterium]NCT19179.1 four helix bundle protein [Flavobacteriia bacterium]